MFVRSFSIAVTIALGLVPLVTAASAQERDLPEEVRALAAVCSSGAKVEFRGQIEGGIFRLFGKVLEGEGEFEISKSETDFLNSFEEEELRLEARKIYNECALGALQIIYNLKQENLLGVSDSQLLVPNALVQLRSGTKFVLRLGDSIGLEEGGIVSVYRKQGDCGKPSVKISNSAISRAYSLDLSDIFKIPERENCWITLYGMRSLGEENACAYSFLYQCK